MDSKRGDSGSALMQAMIIAGVVSMMAMYFSSRTVAFKNANRAYVIKTQVISDRDMIVYDLRNRPFP